MLQEPEILGCLGGHPNIVQLRCVAVSQETLRIYIVMYLGKWGWGFPTHFATLRLYAGLKKCCDHTGDFYNVCQFFVTGMVIEDSQNGGFLKWGIPKSLWLQDLVVVW